MGEKLKAGQRERFCQVYLRTLDPERAAAAIGRADGWALLDRPAVRRRIERLRESWAEQITRRDAIRRLAELAFGRADDAAALALAGAAGPSGLEGLDLSAVAELKITDKGVEVKFLDRVRALETLCELLGEESGGAAAFFQALEEAGEDGEGP